MRSAQETGEHLLPDPDRAIDSAFHTALHAAFHAAFQAARELPERYRRGLFQPRHTLSPAAHTDLIAVLEPWLTARRRQCDVVEVFGPPSWRSGDALAYATDDPADPMVVFVAHDDAVTAAWTSEDPFPKGLRLTTAGRERLANRAMS